MKKGWAELKEAFWAALEGGPAERARRTAELATIDPALPARLDALLEADAAGDPLERIFELEPVRATPPARIGGYRVIGLLGAGGMGEVYRAHDDRLGRDVAIKVLPSTLANDRERLARLEREARVLASLNHPHVAQIYGLEDADGAPALVMELVLGPTLAQLLAGYPAERPPMRRALEIAWQIADGLAAAHEKGFVHRDLKPSNIALTEDGKVKILDFGVAKGLAESGAPPGGSAPGTAAGMLLGTPAYMSPEQARGLSVDRRADIWAFGCIVYELLTGRGAFAAPTPSDSLAAVLGRDVDPTLLPTETPPELRALLRHCLEKDPSRRLRDVADARLAIEDALERPAAQQNGSGGRESPGRPRTPVEVPALGLLAAFAAVAVFGAAAAWRIAESANGAPAPRTVTSLVLPRGMRLTGSDPLSMSSESRFAISPDGRRLALVAADTSGQQRLWVRELGSAVFQPLAESEGASFPFWSPDSESVGFVSAGRLRTLAVYGGQPVTVSESGFRTGSWSRDGRILFTPAGRSPLYVVPATGGTPQQVTTLDTANGEVQHSYPWFLPDGRHFLYFAYGSLSGGALDPRGVFLGSLDGSTPSTLLLADATQPRYASGHLLFVRGGTLMAQPFDADRMVLHGTPFPLVEDVKLSTTGATGAAAGYSVSESGVLAYQAALRTQSRPVWLDHTGTQLGVLAPPADYGDGALSPDGLRVAVSVADPVLSTRDVWIYETRGGPGQRLTSGPGDEFAPVWSPDGRRLLFSATRGGTVDLFTLDLGGAGEPAPVESDSLGQGRFATDWSADGRFILYIGGGRAIATSDLWMTSWLAPGEARALLSSSFVETHARVAPSGDWLVYTSNETGRLEVYTDRFPGGGAKRLISSDGGGWPRWSRDGSEIFYLTPDNQLMVVAVRETGGQLEAASPQRLFTARPRPGVRLDAYAYDVSPDGRTFLLNELLEEPASSTLTLVLNWLSGPDGR